jgi:hypothetical protein
MRLVKRENEAIKCGQLAFNESRGPMVPLTAAFEATGRL